MQAISNSWCFPIPLSQQHAGVCLVADPTVGATTSIPHPLVLYADCLGDDN